MALSIVALLLFLGWRKIRHVQDSLIALMCVLGLTGSAGHSLAQSIPSAAKPSPVPSEGEKLLREMERKLLEATSRAQQIRTALELPSLITETPSATRLLQFYGHVRLWSAMDQLAAPTVPDYSRGQFKAVVKEKLGGRDAFKVEWHVERSVFASGCMFCPPRKTVVQDKHIVWIDAATKLPLQQASPDGSVKRYRSIESTPRLASSPLVQPASK